MHFTFWSCWLRIVSIAIAVLPGERSPMINSRWPRPTFVIESIALMPVWSGSFTGWRGGTAGGVPSPRRGSGGAARPLRGVAGEDAGPLPLPRPGRGCLDRPLAVGRVAERIDDAAEQRLADRH